MQWELDLEFNWWWDNGETFGVLFKGSLSLPSIREDELAQLRIHRKRCLKSKTAQSLMLLGDLKDKSTNDTSLTKGGTVCVVPSQVLNSEELNDHEKGGHLRKVENGVSGAVGRVRNEESLSP